MAGMNDLLNKYGTEKKPAPEKTAEPPRQPEVRRSPGPKPVPRPADRGTAGEARARSAGTGPSGSFGGGPSGGRPEGWGGARQEEPAGSAMSGSFSGGGGAGRSARPAGRTGRSGGRALPPLWGVDAALLAVTVIGVVWILLHLGGVLLAIAQAIYNILSFLMGIGLVVCVLAGFGVMIAFAMRGRRRY